MEMAIHFSILARRVPWTKEPGGLQSAGPQRVRHNWSNSAHTQWASYQLHTRAFHAGRYKCQHNRKDCEAIHLHSLKQNARLPKLYAKQGLSSLSLRLCICGLSTVILGWQEPSAPAAPVVDSWGNWGPERYRGCCASLWGDDFHHSSLLPFSFTETMSSSLNKM